MRVLLLLFFDLGLYESLGHLNLLAAASQRYLKTTKISYDFIRLFTRQQAKNKKKTDPKDLCCGYIVSKVKTLLKNRSGQHCK
jgi:hypothetical protein